MWYGLALLGILGSLLITTVDTKDYRQTAFYATTLERKDSLIDLLSQKYGRVPPQNNSIDKGSELSQQQTTVKDLGTRSSPLPSKSSIQAGWGKANITPSPPVRLTGKNFKPFDQVFDSVYVRTILFSDPPHKVLMVNYDLWIIHPNLADYIRRIIQEKYPAITGVYFTANHSHTSIGGWASGLLGQLVVGGNSEKTLSFIGAQTLASIAQSLENLSR